MVKILILILLAILLAGCKTFGNYEFGDFSKKIIEKTIEEKNRYCSEENEAERALILFAVHKIDPLWVPVCVILEDDSIQPDEI